ncbi:ABC transporter ATP-binding protein [Bradyrhizobium sp. LHD-71]|uniref:ABC transporter ATP-binding protein n=1 Tax=Bradyrhizobium sp. LHD-71 TaxID=3072141 RepID=UPI00280E6A57|nr:ABC transporter ATP-binding protein [Bradyrhizobium sp. LHD-71]MDQ8728175.1 ABC transporter ATP-binding protein [Bradyrhizobium sp. LHD-71]
MDRRAADVAARSSGGRTGLVLEAAELSLVYEREGQPVRAVEEVDFKLEAGERLVLLGPSGCGKSSILKAVAGFLQPASGHILIRGQPVTGPGPDRIVVFQEFDQLLPWKTARQNVAFPLLVAKRIGRQEAYRYADDALRKVGLSHVLDAFPHTLSGGMKQRVAIARALVTQAEILLMDEPFAALDALTRNRLQTDLLALAEELKFTLVFVTHSVEEAVLIGTRIQVLGGRPGRTVATISVDAPQLKDRTTFEFQDIVRHIHGYLQSEGTEKAA